MSNEYTLSRAKRIERNNDRLLSLGLISDEERRRNVVNAWSHAYALPEGASVSRHISIGKEKSSDAASSGSECNSESDTAGEDGDVSAASLAPRGDDDVGESSEGVGQPSLEVLHPMRGRFKNVDMRDLHQREEEYFSSPSDVWLGP